jgi:flagellar motor protein MotB
MPSNAYGLNGNFQSGSSRPFLALEIQRVWKYLRGMGKAPWESAVGDADLQAVGAGLRSGGSSRWGRVLGWAAGIIGLTVLLAFYVPLSQAHGELLEQHKVLVGKAKELEQSVIKANTAQKAAENRSDELDAREKQKQAQAAALKQRSDSARSALSVLLQKHAKKGFAGLGTSADGLVVALADNLVFEPRKLEVSSDGQTLLCEIQKASAGRPLKVTAVVDPKASIPQLKQKYGGQWELSSARVASAAEVLESKCGVARARLSSGSLAPTQTKAAFEGAKPPPAHVAIEIDFSEGS